MARWLLLLMLFVAGVAVAVPGETAVAQTPTTACASTLWLEPLAATPEAQEAATDAATPAWMSAELTDACSGQRFALADFSGKVLFIEPMATWCVNCHGQLTRLKEAAARIPEEERADVVLVALSSEVELPDGDLAAYAAGNDFPFIFAVMPAEMLRSMADDLGQEVAVPPATPHLIVTPDGAVGELRTGSVSADDLLALLTEAARPAES